MSEYEEIKKRLFKEFEIDSEHKHADLLFFLAWEYGHSGGEEEIRNYVIDLQPFLT